MKRSSIKIPGLLFLALVTFLFSENWVIAQISSTEREALIALYNSTDGDNWADNSGWKDGTPYTDGFAIPGTENTWYGITCDDGNTTVLNINLFNNQLTGSIPAELGNLENLITLWLSRNQLTGPIPEELGNLTDLTGLYLYRNQLTGPIPGELGNLNSLLNLNLYNNNLTGSIPAQLGNLNNMRELYLYSNQLTGSIPPELGNLNNIRVLILDYNQLTGPLPPELGNLTNMTTLSLINNQLSGDIPTELGSLTNLTYLNLCENQLTGNIPKELGNLTNLTNLYLSDNQFSGEIPNELGNLTNLMYLDLYYNQLSGIIPIEMMDMISLSYIDICYNHLYATDQDLKDFLNNLQPGWEDCQLDDCPDDPDKMVPGICGCGTPDADSDGDGVADCQDNCPDDPDKAEPGICGCGVADIDSDSDGTADCNDGCPDDTNKTDPGTCGCGITDIDSDSDGAMDCVDTDDDNDGMPDEWEQEYGLNPLVNDADDDADADGYSNIQEFQAGTKPNNVDDFPIQPLQSGPTLNEIVDPTENEPTLDWENLSDASYYFVQYDDNSGFSNPITIEDIAPSEYTVKSALSDGDWYWRVKAVNEDGNETLWSSIGTFTINTASLCGSIIEKPILLTPADGIEGASLTPILSSSPFFDSEDCNIHEKTRWQISEHTDFNSLTFNANSELTTNENLTSLQISGLILEPDTTYYWRVRYWGDHGDKSEWSDVSSFTTESYDRDINYNGIPDDQEVDDLLDLDGDGTPDNSQTDEIKSVNMKKGNTSVGVCPIDSEILSVEAIDDETLPEGDMIEEVPWGLVSFRLKVPSYGDTALVNIYLSEPADNNTTWMKYDPVNGWQDYSDHTLANDTGDVITIELKDGGYGDSDHTENCIIVDPSGPVVLNSGNVISIDDAYVSGGCFIATAAYGLHMESHVRILSSFRDRFFILLIILLFCLGLTRVVRRNRKFKVLTEKII